MTSMFYNCYNLLQLDISSFYVNDGGVCYTENMFTMKSGVSSMNTLITPYYMGAASIIVIEDLGLSLNGVAINAIEQGTSKMKLTKAA